MFVCADVRGVFCSLFVDTSSGFEVVDSSGEDLKEVFISVITQAEEGVVTTHDNRLHELEDGDSVVFREVVGMEELNQSIHTIKVRLASAYACFC